MGIFLNALAGILALLLFFLAIGVVVNVISSGNRLKSLTEGALILLLFLIAFNFVYSISPMGKSSSLKSTSSQTPIPTETQTVSEACREIPRFGNDACGTCKECQYLEKNDCPGQNSSTCESIFKHCNALILSQSCR